MNGKVKNLSVDESYAKFSAMLSGEMAESEIEEFLLALKEKGETADEILGAAKAMRKLALKFDNSFPDIMDVCGTGGDGLSTLNISTAVAFVVAACGVKVAKHGNKAVSSASGSSDVVSELGIRLDSSTLEETNFVYLHAPSYHTGMKYISPVRAKLKTRTIFNLLGPLCSPAQAKRQLIGVYDANLLRPFAEVLRGLGTKKAWIVHGENGMDEISISGKTQVAELDKGAIDIFEISPEDFGLPTYPIEEIKGGDAKYNAQKMRDLFNGEKGAYRDIVLLNSADALIVADKVHTIEEGISQAAKAIDSGKANEIVYRLSNIVYR